MKKNNATTQDFIHWDNILGAYQNSFLKMHEKLNRELREAHYSGRGELCLKIKASCEKTAGIIKNHRYSLGNIPRS